MFDYRDFYALSYGRSRTTAKNTFSSVRRTNDVKLTETKSLFMEFDELFSWNNNINHRTFKPKTLWFIFIGNFAIDTIRPAATIHLRIRAV